MILKEIKCSIAGGFTAGPPQGETRPPRGAGRHTQWATVGVMVTAGPPQGETRPHAQAGRRAGLRLGARRHTQWATVGATFS